MAFHTSDYKDYKVTLVVTAKHPQSEKRTVIMEESMDVEDLSIARAVEYSKPQYESCRPGVPRRRLSETIDISMLRVFGGDA